LFKSLKQRVEELSREIALLKAERDRFNFEAREWAEKRDSAHEQIRKLRTEIFSLKEKRDELNEKVRELKSLREQAKREREEKHTQILKLKEKMRSIMEKKPSRDKHSLKEEIESLEWKIQTTPLTLKEEKLLVDQVRILEAQLLTHKQIQRLRDNLIELQTEEEAIEVKVKAYHEKLSEFAEQSQKFHQRMVEVLDKVRAFQAEADDMHQKYMEVKKQAQGFHKKYIELLHQVRSLKQEFRKAEEERQAKRQLELRKELQGRALEKLKRGEKLTWEEFKILVEQGIS